mmetsp:Transcript_3684/g.10649  ORF Transcript_3684/g.10649 Transcript_3684/m.10649 type:complete len:138 (+) Transcript_3684:99-512(+)
MASMPSAKMSGDEEMRAKQMANMQMGEDDAMQQQQQQMQQQKEMGERKRIMVRSMLEPEALERLNRLGIIKPEKKQQLENVLLNLMQNGQIQEKMSDTALVQLIEKVDTQLKPAATSVKFQRKRRDDSDSDIDLDNL